MTRLTKTYQISLKNSRNGLMFERENVSVKDKRKNISNPLAIFPSAKLVNKISPTEKINTNTSCKNARVLTLRAKVDKIVNRSRKKNEWKKQCTDLKTYTEHFKWKRKFKVFTHANYHTLYATP